MFDGYPSDWGQRSRQTKKRDDYTCQNCGARGGPYGDTELHAHHVVPKSRGGTHALSNLQTLCKSCHDATHGWDTSPSGSTTVPASKWGSKWWHIVFLVLTFGVGNYLYATYKRVKYAEATKGRLHAHFWVLVLTVWWTFGLGNAYYAWVS